MIEHNIFNNFEPLSLTDGPEVISIFNYYIQNSYAAFLQQPVPNAFFEQMLKLLGSFPSVGIRKDGHLVGFGMLHPHNPMPVFTHTAEITYFIHPDYTGKGIGGKMLSFLEMKGREIDICNILAQISSLNEGSIRFHQKHGFVHCGRFVNIGEKSGVLFDTVWMQKII